MKSNVLPSRKMVIPGDAANSYLIKKMENSTDIAGEGMPPSQRWNQWYRRMAWFAAGSTTSNRSRTYGMMDSKKGENRMPTIHRIGGVFLYTLMISACLHSNAHPGGPRCRWEPIRFARFPAISTLSRLVHSIFCVHVPEKPRSHRHGCRVRLGRH